MTFKFISLVALFVGGILAFSAGSSAQEAIFVVRHTDQPPILSIDEILDETPLSESGQQRAKILAERLKYSGVSAIYATKTVRTVQTAEPLAKILGLEIRVRPPEDVHGLVKLLRSDHRRDRVLVVGHWSTIPLIIKALGYPQEITIGRSEFDNLFLVIPQSGQATTVLHLRY
jgi:broad specificity phosphatase PhoE